MMRKLALLMIALWVCSTAQAAGPDFGGLDQDRSGALAKTEVQVQCPEGLNETGLAEGGDSAHG